MIKNSKQYTQSSQKRPFLALKLEIAIESTEVFANCFSLYINDLSNFLHQNTKIH